MDWEKLATLLERFGIPVLVAAALGYAFYQGLRFVANRVALPLFERLLRHIDMLEKTQNEQRDSLNSIDNTLKTMLTKGIPSKAPDVNNRGGISTGCLLWFAALGVLIWAWPAAAIEPAANPAHAIVRIRSHGASATVIATRAGKSWMLGCCHMFLGKGDAIDHALLKRTLKMDGPPQPHAPNQTAHARVLAYDPRVDLSLIELDNGPFNFVPVAPPGHRPSRNVQSLGYDSMKWPMTVRAASVLSMNGTLTFTREKPWHGRSGGALVDVDNRVLIGVVQGYEVTGSQRGMYASHAAIVGFLKRNWPDYPYPNHVAQAPSPQPQFRPIAPKGFGLPPGC